MLIKIIDFFQTVCFGIRNSWSRVIWKNINNSRHAITLSKIPMVRNTIFGKDIDLDKTLLFDSKGQRITNEYCENIIKDLKKKELIN